MLCTVVLLLLQETLCQVENPFQTIIQKDDPFSSSNPETVDIPGRNLDSAHAHFIDFWLKNPDAMLTDIPGIEFPPDSFAGSLSDTTTPIAATTSAAVTTSAPATAAPPRTTQSTNDLRGGHGNGENCVGGVRRDSSGKITHIVDTHDCTLLPVISSDITFDHVIDPRTNEMIFITEPPEVATVSQTTKKIIMQTTGKLCDNGILNNPCRNDRSCYPKTGDNGCPSNRSRCKQPNYDESCDYNARDDNNQYDTSNNSATSRLGRKTHQYGQCRPAYYVGHSS